MNAAVAQLADITPRVEEIEGLVDDLANGGVDTTARAGLAEVTSQLADIANLMGFKPMGAYNPANENKYGEWYTHDGRLIRLHQPDTEHRRTPHRYVALAANCVNRRAGFG